MDSKGGDTWPTTGRPILPLPGYEWAPTPVRLLVAASYSSPLVLVRLELVADYPLPAAGRLPLLASFPTTGRKLPNY